MTMPSRAMLMAGGGVMTVCLAFGYTLGFKPGSAERAALSQQVAQREGFLAQVSRERDGWGKIESELASYVNRTLGGDAETVDHRLRSRLNRIGEELGLTRLTVGTSRPVERQSPAASRYSRRPMERPLREEADFNEVEGTISGEGTLEQAMRLVHRVQTEPWIKRIHQVRFEPRDNGNRCQVSLKLTTLFLPGRQPKSLEAHPYDAASFGPFSALAAANPFRVPGEEKPVRAANQARPDEPAPTIGFPWGQWVLTGVTQEPDGTIAAWLVNNADGTSRRMVVGEAIEQAELVAAGGERAEFRRGQERFAVTIGSNFDQRQVISQ